MAIATPVIVPFNTVDANEYFYIEYAGDQSSTTDDRFFYWRYVVTNLDTNTIIEYPHDFVKINRTGNSTIQSYLDPLYSDGTRTIPVGVWMAVNKNYYFCFPKNYVYNNQIVFENGYHYSIEIDFGVTSSKEVTTVPYPFACYANFEVALESYQYNDGVQIQVVQNDTLTPYEVTTKKSFCKLNFSYTQEEGEPLKYYQFSLFNDKGNLLGRSNKIYGIPDGGIVYAIENYNNLQHYTLKLYCVTQTNRDSTTTVIIHTDYEQDNIYADITFLLDTETATNNVSISVTQLNGEGKNYSFDDNGEYVVIPDNGYVEFIDTYQTISKNFLCRMWCRNLNQNTPILKIDTADGSGYVEVFFTGQNFVAYKYSCGLATSYTSNYLIEEGNITETQNIYFAIGYYDGRIEMYTTIID